MDYDGKLVLGYSRSGIQLPRKTNCRQVFLPATQRQHDCRLAVRDRAPDFKPENMLCDGSKYAGLNIHWRNVGAAAYDPAPFLNHLRSAGRVMGRVHTNHFCELAEAEFMVGYGGSVPVRALRWAYLYCALCYLGGYRARGRPAAIYAYLRVRPLVLNLARRFQEAA